MIPFLSSHQPCRGDDDGLIEIIDVSGGKSPYSYRVEGFPFDTASKFTFLAPGEYVVSIMDSSGCVTDSVISIDQGLDFQVDLGQDTLIALGDTITLYPVITPASTVIDRFVWTPDNYLDPLIDLEARVFPPQSTTYFLSVESPEGCMASDDILISVRHDFEIFIPNIVSPDQDGINDGLEVFAGKGVERLLSARVYNRWGELVFEETGTPILNSLIWKGDFNGEKCPNGVYIYLIEILTTSGQTVRLSGDFTLIR